MENRTSFGQPRLLRSLPSRPILRVAMLAAALAVGVAIAAAAYYGFYNHPTGQPLRGAEAEARMAAVLSRPEGFSDATVTGDLLIERFFVVDIASGRRFVLDVCKGRVRNVMDSRRQDGIGSYRLLLERSGLPAERDRLTAYVNAQAPAALDDNVEYLGFQVQSGNMESFAVNFDGSVPDERSDFAGTRGEDVYSYLRDQSYDDISFAGASLVNVRGTNYLVSNSELYGYFKSEFKLTRAIFISELIILDWSSPQSILVYQQIANRIPVKP